MEVNFDKYSLIIDGKRTYIKSGAFHYFRVPGAELAKDRFLKLKAAGYNAVDLYFHWQYHSEEKGKYDFAGLKDVRKVLQMARDVGLFVIARPGPFINGELSAGGLPFWLIEDDSVIPRNRVGTEYHYSPEYMKYITEWYDNIIPIITEFNDIVIGFQIENEYATDTMEEDYMRELYKMAREKGITCPIFHNDAYFCGLWADVVDIYACDYYPYINPNQNWKKDNFCFDSLDNNEEMFRSCKENSPIFIAELQAGWFDKWDGQGYKHLRDALGDQHINIMTKTALSQGTTMFNHYMAVGGTSWGNLACDEVYTSYEFCAPIDEYGIPKDNFFKAKELNYFLQSFGFTKTEPLDFEFYQEGIYTKLRQDLENNCEWLFVRNLNPETENLKLPNGFEVKIKPYDMKICPLNLKLKACEIKFSDVEIFAKLSDENNDVIFFISDEGASIHLENGEIISGNKKDYERVKFENENKTTQFVFLTKSLADKTWIIDNKVIFNADIVYSNGVIALNSSRDIAYFDLIYGFSKKHYKVTSKLSKFNLENLEVSFCSNPIDNDFDYSKWKKTIDKTDAFSCKLYDEFIWYKGQIPNNIKEIILSARHLFAVYINEKEVLNRNSYKIEKLQQIPETIQISLNKKILFKPMNEITILVQNLGFDKGFSGDTNHPRGLVTFKTEPETDIQFYVSEKLPIEQKIKRESETPYLAKITSTFNLDFKDNESRAKYIYLKHFPYRRATIYLNGHKIGRYIKRTCVQDKFYLIDTFLKEKNTIDIVIWQKSRNIATKWDFKNEIKNVIIEIGDEKCYQLFN